MSPSQINSNFLRGVLAANAVFSGLCAALFLSFSEPAAEFLLKTVSSAALKNKATFFISLGIGLLLFTVLVAWTAIAARVSRFAVVLIILSDVIWVMATAAALMGIPELFTPVGLRGAIAVAAVVLIFAIGQGIGLIALHEAESDVRVSAEGRIRVLTAELPVDAPSKIAWQVMTDHEAYAEVADNLRRVEVLSGGGEGMERKCTAKGGEAWTEYAHLWEEGRRYGFTVNTDARGYPYPLEELSGLWAVEPRGDKTCLVKMTFRCVASRGLHGALFVRVMLWIFPKVIDRLLRRWKERMEGAAPASI